MEHTFRVELATGRDKGLQWIIYERSIYNLPIIDYKIMIDAWFPHYVIVPHGIFILYDYHLTLK